MWFLLVGVVAVVIGFSNCIRAMFSDTVETSGLFKAFGLWFFMVLVAGLSWILFLIGAIINIIQYLQAG